MWMLSCKHIHCSCYLYNSERQRKEHELFLFKNLLAKCNVLWKKSRKNSSIHSSRWALEIFTGGWRRKSLPLPLTSSSVPVSRLIQQVNMDSWGQDIQQVAWELFLKCFEHLASQVTWERISKTLWHWRTSLVCFHKQEVNKYHYYCP